MRELVQDQRVLKHRTLQLHLNPRMVKVKQIHSSLMKRVQVRDIQIVRECEGLFKCAVRHWSTGAHVIMIYSILGVFI